MQEMLRNEDDLRDLVTFHNVARALTSALEIKQILSTIVEEMARFFQPESWAMLMVDETQNDLYYAVVAGSSDDDLLTRRVRMGEGMAGWVAQRGETLIVPALQEDPRFSISVPAPTTQMSAPRPEAHSSLRFRVHSAISLPLRTRHRTLGVIQLFNVNLDSLSDYTITFLHILCDYAAIAVDNSRAVQRIHELTLTDECTGLYNLRHLHERLGQESERALRLNHSFCLVFIDLDNFKQVNDKYGHMIGTRLLGELGKRLQTYVRTVDSCFRYGGDEFVVLMPETDHTAGTQAALRLREHLKADTFLVEAGYSLKMTASFGIACYPQDGGTVQEVLRVADAFMYMAKTRGRDGVASAASQFQTGY